MCSRNFWLPALSGALLAYVLYQIVINDRIDAGPVVSRQEHPQHYRVHFPVRYVPTRCLSWNSSREYNSRLTAEMYALRQRRAWEGIWPCQQFGVPLCCLSLANGTLLLNPNVTWQSPRTQYYQRIMEVFCEIKPVLQQCSQDIELEYSLVEDGQRRRSNFTALEAVQIQFSLPVLEGDKLTC